VAVLEFDDGHLRRWANYRS